MGGFFVAKILFARERAWGFGEIFGSKGCEVDRNGVKW